MRPVVALLCGGGACGSSALSNRRACCRSSASAARLRPRSSIRDEFARCGGPGTPGCGVADADEASPPRRLSARPDMEVPVMPDSRESGRAGSCCAFGGVVAAPAVPPATAAGDPVGGKARPLLRPLSRRAGGAAAAAPSETGLPVLDVLLRGLERVPVPSSGDCRKAMRCDALGGRAARATCISAWPEAASAPRKSAAAPESAEDDDEDEDACVGVSGAAGAPGVCGRRVLSGGSGAREAKLSPLRSLCASGRREKALFGRTACAASTLAQGPCRKRERQTGKKGGVWQARVNTGNRKEVTSAERSALGKRWQARREAGGRPQ